MDAEETLDARGLRCPVPVIRMEAALRRLAPGARLTIIADDPVAAVDIPHFAEAAGHGCRSVPAEPGVCVFLVTRAEKP
jgi:tRNA 2-thiouridine synthesizing protein A